MSDNPLDRATSSPPPVVGEGCAARYDPEALTPDHGTDFPEAQALWRAVTDARPAGARPPLDAKPDETP